MAFHDANANPEALSEAESAKRQEDTFRPKADLNDYTVAANP